MYKRSPTTTSTHREAVQVPPPRHSLALLAVVQHDGVVVAAGDERLAVGTEVEAVDLVRVLAEDLGHAEAPQHVVRQLHAAARGGEGETARPATPTKGEGKRGGKSQPAAAERRGGSDDGPTSFPAAPSGGLRSSAQEAAPVHCVRHLAAPGAPEGGRGGGPGGARNCGAGKEIGGKAGKAAETTHAPQCMTGQGSNGGERMERGGLWDIARLRPRREERERC